ncbi:UMP-CMP kinase-like [Callorhinus ursinus]|uniref:UMP-CMP kinase-like n=1 Tax=Callorhinus ursinus TaxID=34884 RepID=UPI003CD0325D
MLSSPNFSQVVFDKDLYCTNEREFWEYCGIYLFEDKEKTWMGRTKRTGEMDLKSLEAAALNPISTLPSCASVMINIRFHDLKYGYTKLSAGELLLDERKNPDTQYGELTEKYIKDGKMVPVEITISLLKSEMDQTMAANAQKNKFLIDGFARNQDNLQGWKKTMDEKADVSFILVFYCNSEICIERCLERGKSSGRSDDNRESLEKRIQTYLQSTKPIIDLYEEMGKVKKIDDSRSVEVFDEIDKIFDKKR